MAETLETLNTHLILRMLREENSLKVGEGYKFKLNLTYPWEVQIIREEERYAPYKWELKARCLHVWDCGTYATEARRYLSIERALLHCLNRFNDNVAIRNKYKSIEDCFTYETF